MTLLCLPDSKYKENNIMYNFEKKFNGTVKFTYPDWKMKALAFSYDDANIADRRLVEIFNRYGMKGTFHIPSAWLKTKSENRITEAEINTLYDGHEVSGHGANHLNMAQLAKDEIAQEVAEDCREWQRILGHKLTGYSYPYGAYSNEVIEVLKANNLIYSRTVEHAEDFYLPEDFMKWHPHAHHRDNIAELGIKFLDFKAEKLSVLLIWGHSYEIPRENHWELIEDFCAQMANKEDIFYASMGDIARYVNAISKITTADNGKTLINNSDETVYYLLDGQKCVIEPAG